MLGYLSLGIGLLVTGLVEIALEVVLGLINAYIDFYNNGRVQRLQYLSDVGSRYIILQYGIWLDMDIGLCDLESVLYDIYTYHAFPKLYGGSNMSISLFSLLMKIVSIIHVILSIVSIIVSIVRKDILYFISSIFIVLMSIYSIYLSFVRLDNIF